MMFFSGWEKETATWLRSFWSLPRGPFSQSVLGAGQSLEWSYYLDGNLAGLDGDLDALRDGQGLCCAWSVHALLCRWCRKEFAGHIVAPLLWMFNIVIGGDGGVVE